MPTILKTTYMDFYPANENNIVLRPVYSGLSFNGFEPVKEPIFNKEDVFLGV